MTTDERIASIRNGQYPCGCQAVGAVAFLLTELDAARAERSAELKSLSDHFAVLLAEREWLREQNAKLTTIHAERTVERDAAQEREAKLREALEVVAKAPFHGRAVPPRDAYVLVSDFLGAVSAALAEGEDTQ